MSSSRSEFSDSADCVNTTSQLQPLLGRELLHPVDGAGTSSSLSTYNVFSEQEKAFFKRSERLQQLPIDTRNKDATILSTPEALPKSMKPAAEVPTWGLSQPTYNADPPPKSSFKYDNIPPYRATPSIRGDESTQLGERPSNQFGVLVPGWGSSTSMDGSSGSVFDVGETRSGAGMQFVPVVTKGSGAPGRGPTKRKKP
ncbi:hypothetical protein M407DRAFT_219189 [Tulasnella calospora MUT 4182]|uniref:Uncharacterized protein n=1 Tax=Tulasnella calospora MUT 4182 TaxID=1051891 RepID=A0A0C3QAE3_9AGAM|nr:hypothetical protein M407DRAFT_219189 [Tulasnella calospora MUT 4182]